MISMTYYARTCEYVYDLHNCFKQVRWEVKRYKNKPLQIVVACPWYTYMSIRRRVKRIARFLRTPDASHLYNLWCSAMCTFQGLEPFPLRLSLDAFSPAMWTSKWFHRHYTPLKACSDLVIPNCQPARCVRVLIWLLSGLIYIRDSRQ